MSAMQSCLDAVSALLHVHVRADADASQWLRQFFNLGLRKAMQACYAEHVANILKHGIYIETGIWSMG